MRKITFFLLFCPILIYGQITPLTYSMNGSTMRSTINSNVSYLSNYNIGIDTITKVVSGLSYANYIARINTMFASITAEMGRNDVIYTPLNTVTKGALLSTINANFNVLMDSTEVYDYVLLSKTLTIPNKGQARVLSQNANWKLAIYPTQDTLWLSNDNGLTWDYKKAYAGVENIRMAYVFRNGNIVVGMFNNTMFHSTDSLKTIEQIYVQENGENMVFHTPSNASYPGVYFTTVGGVVSHMVGDKEVLLWGTYCNYSNAAEMNGAVPINMYYSADQGMTMKVAYRYGVNRPVGYDNGTATGASSGGTYLGHPTNLATTHIHGVSYQPKDSTFVIAHGEGGSLGFMKYNFQSDTWSHSYAIGNQAVRTCYYSFDGDTVIWSSDGDSSIYKATYTDLKAGTVSYTKLLYTKNLQLGVTKMDTVIFSVPFGCNSYGDNNIFSVGTNFGRTWQYIPLVYRHALRRAYNENYTINMFLNGNPDVNGYYCVNQSLNGNTPPFYNSGHYSLMLKVIKKPGATPNF